MSIVVDPSPPPTLARLGLIPEGAVRIAPILALPDLLAQMGQDPGALIAESGVDPALFSDPDNTLPFATAGRLLALCAARTGCPHLGILLGAGAGPEVLGVVGRLARCSADLGSALRSIILYLHLHDRGAIPTLSVSGDRAKVAYAIYRPEVPGTAVIYDLAITLTNNIIKALGGPSWQAREVCLCRPQPLAIAPYREEFRTRLRFGAEHNAVVFDAAWLDHPLGGADALAQRQIMLEIQGLETQGAGDLPRRARINH